MFGGRHRRSLLVIWRVIQRQLWRYKHVHAQARAIRETSEPSATHLAAAVSRRLALVSSVRHHISHIQSPSLPASQSPSPAIAKRWCRCAWRHCRSAASHSRIALQQKRAISTRELSQPPLFPLVLDPPGPFCLHHPNSAHCPTPSRGPPEDLTRNACAARSPLLCEETSLGLSHQIKEPASPPRAVGFIQSLSRFDVDIEEPKDL